jgi:hypothetical protein
MGKQSSCVKLCSLHCCGLCLLEPASFVYWFVGCRELGHPDFIFPKLGSGLASTCECLPQAACTRQERATVCYSFVIYANYRQQSSCQFQYCNVYNAQCPRLIDLLYAQLKVRACLGQLGDLKVMTAMKFTARSVLETAYVHQHTACCIGVFVRTDHHCSLTSHSVSKN